MLGGGALGFYPPDGQVGALAQESTTDHISLHCTFPWLLSWQTLAFQGASGQSPKSPSPSSIASTQHGPEQQELLNEIRAGSTVFRLTDLTQPPSALPAVPLCSSGQSYLSECLEQTLTTSSLRHSLFLQLVEDLVSLITEKRVQLQTYFTSPYLFHLLCPPFPDRAAHLGFGTYPIRLLYQEPHVTRYPLLMGTTSASQQDPPIVS